MVLLSKNSSLEFSRAGPSGIITFLNSGAETRLKRDQLIYAEDACDLNTQALVLGASVVNTSPYTNTVGITARKYKLKG